MFDKLKYFVAFIGHGRSGHSIFGAILDAHKNAVISHEARVIDMIINGDSRDEILNSIIKNSIAYRGDRFQSEAGFKRLRDSYDYTIEDEWQGKWDEIHVIGDKSGGLTTRMIAGDFSLAAQLIDRVQLPVKWVHVIRNPFDMISTSCKRKRTKPSRNACRILLQRCRINERIINSVGRGNVATIRHENLLRSPKIVIRQLCKFLGLEQYNNYVKNAASIVYSEAHQSRHEVSWPKSLIKFLEAGIGSVPHLRGYSWSR